MGSSEAPRQSNSGEHVMPAGQYEMIRAALVAPDQVPAETMPTDLIEVELSIRGDLIREHQLRMAALHQAVRNRAKE